MKKLYLVFTVVLLIIILPACKKGNKGDDTRTVQYSIECTDCFVVCYDENGAEKSWQHQNNTWTYSFEGESGDVLLLAAQNSGNTPQGVTGRIKVDGTVAEERTTYCPISGTVLVVDTLNF